ncbi:MAG: protein kinase [Deltaproteobacteria bacterium]|nr:protein kinase [Deltaproteobacteria bacterium]
MGRVLKAIDQVLGVPVAIKVVKPEFAADERFRKLFDLEVKISARFTHQHIVPLHDVGEMADRTPFLGLAFADAGSFASFREHPPAWTEALRLTQELIDALSHLHTRGVLHRDLKPENILLHTGEDGRRHVWLADLGLAKTANTLAQRKGRVEGTPGFMAPEQLLGLPREYGPWTDLFSVGVVLWELVTGALPFPIGRSPLDDTLGPLVPRAGMQVPEGLELILQNLLHPEPLARYDLAADLRTELLALASPEGAGRLPAEGRADGTVARSFASFPDSGGASGADGAPPGSDQEDDAPVFEVPRWNRPIPGRIPRRPPLQRGFGAVARASLPLFAVRELPLVGRDRFRAELWNQVRAVAKDGRSRVVFVVGEAGSGKTHLIQDLLWTLEEGGWAEPLALSYQDPPGKEDGYAGAARQLIRPWNESRPSLEMRLRRRLGRERGRMDEAVREEAAVLARWAGLARDGEETVAAGYGLQEVYRHLDARTWRGLSVVFLDNVHWAREDGDGLEIAEKILRSERDGERRKVLVFATLRSEDLSQHPEIDEKLAALVEQGASRVDLPRLSRYGTRELISESLTLTTELADRLAERCDGNPLFAKQLLIEWVERGWLEDKGGLQYGLVEGVDPDKALPADAEALFFDRVDALGAASGLPDAFWDLVHTVALVGEQIPVELFLPIAGHELQDFARVCGLWTEQDGWLRFDHGLLHQALRGQAEDRPDAHRLHLRLARAWVRYGRAQNVSVHLQVGRHAHEGRAWRMALADLIPACKQAWSEGRADELDEASAMAVKAAGEMGDQGAGAGWAYFWRGRAWQRRGVAREAWRAHDRARALFEAEGNGLGLVEALLGLGEAARQAGDLADARRRFTSAQRRAKAAGDIAIEARAIQGLAWLEQQQRNLGGADVLFTKALNRCRQDGDARGAAEASMGHAFLSRHAGEFKVAEELYAEAGEDFLELGDRLGYARVLLGLAAVDRQQGALDQALEQVREALQIAEGLGATPVVMDARLSLAELSRAMGDVGKAAPLYEEHLRWARKIRSFDGAVLASLGLAMVALERGDLDALHEQASQTAHFLQRIPEHWLWAPYRLVVAAMLAQRGDEDSTYRWLWSAAELGLDKYVDQDVVALLLLIADAAYQERWVNTLRLAGQHARHQLKLLGRLEDERALHGKMSALLSGA